MITAGEIELLDQSTSSGISLRGRTVPGYIAVEGPIGVGKTPLARRIADTFEYDLMLEEAELNPFLERFYQNRQQTAHRQRGAVENRGPPRQRPSSP